jgi:hypothetical protein
VTAAADIGIAEQGYEVSVRHGKEMISESDAYGLMAVDAVFRGISDVFVQATLMEWKTASLLAALPYNAMAASGATTLSPGVIGRLDTAVAGIMIWTATTSTPAASAPATMTATYAIAAEGFDVSWSMNSKLRKLPVKWRCYAYLDTTVKILTAT